MSNEAPRLISTSDLDLVRKMNTLLSKAFNDSKGEVSLLFNPEVIYFSKLFLIKNHCHNMRA